MLKIPSESVLEDPLGEAISNLSNTLSLLELDDESDPWLHRLIASFVRNSMEEEEGLRKNIVRAIRDEMSRTKDEKDTESLRALEKVAPHAAVIASAPFTGPEDAVDILDSLMTHNQKRGRYRAAEGYGRRALSLSEENAPEKTSTMQSNLATVLQDLGELEEARDLAKAAYETFIAKFGPGHPSTKTTKGNLEGIEAMISKAHES